MSLDSGSEQSLRPDMSCLGIVSLRIVDTPSRRMEKKTERSVFFVVKER